MRRLAISDIHGCIKTLEALLEKLQITKEDEIYFLGDFIDRGSSSSGVLDLIIRLQKEGFDLQAVRGNHEQNLLNAMEEYDDVTFLGYVKKINKAGDLLGDDNKVKPEYLDFINDLPYCIELDDYWIVHAGFNMDADNPMEDYSGMMNMRKYVYKQDILKGKKVLHGHQVHHIDTIEEAIASDAMYIPLDSGCVYNKPHKVYDHTKTGLLLCFDLDSKELIKQENID